MGREYRIAYDNLFDEYRLTDGESSLLRIKPTEHVVWTDCGDGYMDYAIPFEGILKIAKFIEKGEQNEAHE